jgi:hypothetical protein
MLRQIAAKLGDFSAAILLKTIRRVGFDGA